MTTTDRDDAVEQQQDNRTYASIYILKRNILLLIQAISLALNVYYNPEGDEATKASKMAKILQSVLEDKHEQS